MIEYAVREKNTGTLHRVPIDSGGYALAGLVDGLKQNPHRDELEIVYRDIPDGEWVVVE